MGVRRFPLRVLVALLIALFPSITSAQSGVLFIPSTTIQDRRIFHLSLETYHHFGRLQKGGFQSLGPAAVYGLSNDVELGLNYYATRTADGWNHHAEPHIKWRIHNNEDSGAAVALGALAFIPLNKRSITKDAVQLYAVASKQFKRTGELKVTGGFYGVATSDDDYGSKGGVMACVEKPITKKLANLADWTSRNNALGTSNLGLSYKTKESQTLTFAYSFGNTGRGNNFFSAYYGISF
jgi:hypothetical protein